MLTNHFSSIVPVAFLKNTSFARLSTALLLGITPIASPLLSNASFAQSVKYCQCTEYVANRFKLTRDFPNAKDWNDGYLQKNGYTKVGVSVGSIVVMENIFPGADEIYGHVGIVESINPNGTITVRGANQDSKSNPFTEYGCNDVSIIPFGTSVSGRNDISFWVKGSSGIYSVDFSGKAAPSGVNIRSAPSLSAPVIGRLKPNQTVSFNAWTYGDVVTDIWLGTPDARWFRLKNQVKGQDAWVASGVIYGNPPNSKPMP